MVKLPLIDRATAGRELAGLLKHYEKRDDVIVLALPRGGVPVACEIAKSLHIRLDVMMVRKLGLPSHKEYAMGAIASGGIQILMDDIIKPYKISAEDIAKVAASEKQELTRRESAYRDSRPWPNLQNQCVVLVDDGLATGATMRAAIAATRAQGATEITVAVPVAPLDTVEELSALVDECVCLATPTPFLAVGKWYETFDQVSDAEVKSQLAEAWRER